MRLKMGSDNIALKLRNRLLALVMLISSAVLIAAFILIYVLAYIKINSDNSEELNNKEETIVTTISSDGEIHYGDYTSEAIIVNVAYPSSGAYFYLIVDKDGKLILVNTSLDMPEETYEYAAQAAFSRLDKTL